jgi:hypothetical protein
MEDKIMAHVNKTMFYLGLGVALLASSFLLLSIIESGVAAALGILGIGLIAASSRQGRI